MGSGGTLPATARVDASSQVGRYHAPASPGKAVSVMADGQLVTVRGKRAAMLQALRAAGWEGVAHVEVLPWLLNPADAIKALKARGLRIETRRGQPTRWILRSDVQEVRS